MTRRLTERLAGLRAAGIGGVAPYVTAGDGGLDVTLAVLRALDRAGAACVELGVPFSDPIADGPVLQAAAQRSLAAGTTLDGILEMLGRLRAGDGGEAPCELPVVVMTYVNPLLRRGWEGAARALAAAGADGVLVADLPIEEAHEMRRAAAAHDLCPIFFATPTTSDERLATALSASRGFVYTIGRFGVTGAATTFDETALAFLARVKQRAGELPVAVGFGLRGPEDVAAALAVADLAIVGTALVDHIHRAGPDGAADAAEDFTRRLVEAAGKARAEQR